MAPDTVHGIDCVLSASREHAGGGVPVCGRRACCRIDGGLNRTGVVAVDLGDPT